MTNLIWILVILIFLTIPLVIILIYFTFSDNKSNKRKVEYLKKEGKIIEAEITDFKSYTGGSVSAIPAIFLRIVARSFVHGKPQEFKSERIYPNKCKLEVGDKVKILVNMKNPKQYYFDPYQKEY
jgi:hypothetical protein